MSEVIASVLLMIILASFAGALEYFLPSDKVMEKTVNTFSNMRTGFHSNKKTITKGESNVIRA